MASPDDTLDFLNDVIAKARRTGADAADAIFVEGASISHARRLGKLEKLQRAEGQDLGLRVLVGRQQAIVSSSDRSPKAVDELVTRVVAMAKAAPADPFAGLADPGDVAHVLPDLDIFDPVEPAAEVLVERARAAEEAALAVKGINNSEGAEASWSSSRIALAASNGFAASYARSGHSVSASVIAGEGTAMERDYDYSSVLHGADLDDPAAIGRRAAERALKRLNPRKIETCRLPVVLDPRVSAGIVRHLASAINGSSIARGTSFLKDRMGQAIFPAGINIVDDPFRKRGLGSKPVDGEGIAPMRRNVVDKGILTTWFLDLRSARQLKLKSTGHAARGTASPPSPSPTNLYMEPGKITRAAMLSAIPRGLYITEFIGMGVNGITGDYSRGASGFLIENGELAYPVSEITVAGNLKDMFMNLAPADDLVFKYGTDAPTLRIDGLTIAGR
ncbi:MAG: TldD/PmbA family protein [Alphaproteobacteria bacterium]|nr:TldD/PmbA family protein [Alphaproteobacteria bacterium]